MVSRSRGGLKRVAAALAAVLVAASTIAVATAGPAGAVVPPSTKTVSLDATFTTSGQSLWGPGSAAPPTTQHIPLFDESWNASASGGHIESVDLEWSFEAPCVPDVWNLCDYTTDFGHIGDFGAEGTASTSGRIGMSVALEGVSGGTIGVTYPVRVDFTTPADETFGAGDTIEIATSVATRPGGRIDAVQPNITGEAVNGTFAFHAGFEAEVCIFDCFNTGQALLDVPEASGQILHITNADIENQVATSPPDTYCFALPENLLFGLAPYHLPTRCGHSGYLARPTVDVTTTTNPDGSLTATGDDSFVIIPVSAVTWMGRAAGLPLFPPLNLTLNNLGGTGIDLGWTTANLIFNTDVSRSEHLTFTPKVDVTLSFPRSLSYRVLTPANAQVASGTGTSATLRAGNKIRIDVPADQTGSFQVTPSLSLAQHDISNRIEQVVQGSGEFRVLSVTLRTPSASFDMGELGTTEVWPGTDFDIGPVYRVDFPLDTTRTELLNRTWALGGFNAPALAPFSLVPDPPPGVTPVSITPVEGAAFTRTIATFTDDDTNAVPADYAVTINWGDGSAPSTGTVTGSNGSYSIAGTHTYQQYGPYTIGIVLTTVPTGHLATNRVAFNSSAVASDAALAGTGKTNNTTAGGQAVLIWPNPSPPAPNNVVATFTDANPFGLLSDLSATINWGDGTPVTAGVVSGSTGGPFTVAGAHDYTELGLHTVTVTLLSKGGSTATATTTTLSFTNLTGGGGFVVGSQKATGAVTFWGSQWMKANNFKTTVQSAFKGYENQVPPACGTTWSGNSGAGNNSVPPATVPTYMPVIVTGSVNQAGTLTTGTVVSVVIVKTNPGYGPDPSQTGTGTVVAVLCRTAS